MLGKRVTCKEFAVRETLHKSLLNPSFKATGGAGENYSEDRII